ncbi:MAG: peptidase [Planctomycetota bacterium]
MPPFPVGGMRNKPAPIFSGPNQGNNQVSAQHWVGLREAAFGLTLALVLAAGHACADRIELTDGRVLEGSFTLVAGVTADPLAEGGSSRSAGTPILMCDDELTRTFVPRRRVAKVEESLGSRAIERIEIPQRVPENGRRIAAVGGLLEATPFDAFGRRILSMATATGRVDLVQGITQITPRWVSLEGVVTEQPLLLDMRVATTSIPRAELRRVIDQHIDRSKSDQRLRIVRLYLQAERYEDARTELDEVLADFPGLTDLAVERRSLGELSAAKLLEEIELRGRAGQDRLASTLLEHFPADDAGGETVEMVREARDAYREREGQAKRLLGAIQARVEALSDEQPRREAEDLLAEMSREISFATLDRLSTFDRIGTDPDLPADRAVALAVSGWLAGAASAQENLKLALSAARVRSLLRDYLRSTDSQQRMALRGRMNEEEACEPATLAALARQMRPPADPPPATSPGLHALSISGISGEEPTSCLVQLPPEYDPLRRYPVIVSLHGAWSTPLNQIEWWAGLPGPDGLRRGQATRYGYIVIAPQWGREHQTSYGYTAREHAAVLGALREAQRAFSIDTDRVFLSGHSLGGDAAWDIALAHPDLWAGLVAIAPSAGRYVNHYWPNARALPVYIVGGELDDATFSHNSMDLDRYFSKGFDATYVEYRGRGHEHFSDEILRIFSWMERRRRSFFPSTIDAVTMRPWDRFYWWVELAGAPPKTVVLPGQWPPPPSIRPMAVDAKTTSTNGVSVHCGAEQVKIWLSPELVDFALPISVTLNGRKLARDSVRPDIDVLLEDLRLRGDRIHPFWAVVESDKQPSAGSKARRTAP